MTNQNTTKQNTIQKQIKFAVVMYGGVSLAIYINGIAQELLKMVQSTAENAKEFSATAVIYRKIALILSENVLTGKESEDKVKTYLQNIDFTKEPDVRFVIDVLSGSSAGGINAVFLAKALANDLQMDGLKNLWLREGNIAKLLNDKKSVTGTDLDAPEEPASLLNGQRMYLKLLEALNNMDKSNDNPPKESPNVDELDLFVTYTDFAGVPLPIQLSDKLVFERKHKQVFNFRYVKNGEGVTEPNQFLHAYNPFLAFAARCTSAFPFAFEPMKLTKIDKVIEDCLPEFKDQTSENKNRENFFKAATDRNGNEIIWKNRWLVDGGYLDNKPFGYAIDTISKRQTTEIIERKLLYVDPFPETFGNEKAVPDPPDVIQNLLAAAMELPRYETIREDLQRVLERNRLIERVNRLIEESVKDFEKSNENGVLKKISVSEETDWSEKWLDEIVKLKGESVLPYYRLRISAVTDEITKIVADSFKIDEDSGYFKALRDLIRNWRDENYTAYKTDENHMPYKPDEGNKKSYNKFLSDFDIDYRIRRLQFILRKTENLLENKDEIVEKIKQSATKKSQKDYKTVENSVNNQQGLVSDKVAWKYAVKKVGKDKTADIYKDDDFVKAVKWFREELTKAYQHLHRYQEQIRSSEKPQSLGTFFTSLKAVENNIKKAENTRVEKNNEEMKIGETNKNATAADALKRIINCSNENNNSAAGNQNEKRGGNYETKELYKNDDVGSKLKESAELLKKNFVDEIIQPIRNIVHPLLRIKSLYLSYPNDIPDKSIDCIREYLKIFYVLFDSYDQISFPIYYQTPVGEAVPVDVVRISPQDATNLINEEDEQKRKKLAGDSLFAFGGFLDEGWRQNDIMWGRLDGAERLIETLLPDKKYEVLRGVLIAEANQAILKDELLEKDKTKFKVNFVNALLQAKCEAGEQGAISKIISGLNTEKLKSGLDDILKSALNEKEIATVFKADYEVNRRLEPQPLLQTISRSTQITGKILQGVSEKYGQNGGSLSWISKLGYIFFGLVEVAAPNSTWNLFVTYWLKLFYLFEVLLIIGGTLLVSNAIQQFGIVTFALTAAIHLAVLTLHDTMDGTNFLKLLKTVAVFLILALALVGFFALFTFFYANDSLLNSLKELRKYLTTPNNVKNLLPIAALAILLVGLGIWREVRKKNIRFFGWTIVISSLLFLTFIMTIFQTAVQGAKGIGGLPAVLSLEFISDISQVACITNGSDSVRGSLKYAMWLDSFVIVPFYVALFLLMSQLLALANKGWLGRKIFLDGKNWLIINLPHKLKEYLQKTVSDDNKEWLKNNLFNLSTGKVLALIAAICSILGGLFDSVENFFSHWILSLSPPELPANTWLVSAIGWSSNIKFSLIFIAVTILSLIFWRFKQWTKDDDKARFISLSLIGLILVLWGVAGFSGIILGNYHLVETAMNDAFITPVFAGILFIWLNRDFLSDF